MLGGSVLKNGRMFVKWVEQRFSAALEEGKGAASAASRG